MTRLETLKQEFRDCKGPFPYGKLVKLLSGLGYDLKAGSGSGRKFVHAVTRKIIIVHEPHPGNEIKPYMVNQIRNYLIDRNEL